jgi:hypothetical protein
MKKLFTPVLVLFIAFCSFGQVTFTNSNLPIVVVTTDNNAAVVDADKVAATMKIIYNGVNVRNNLTDTQYNFNGRVGIEIRGNSSASFNQKQYGIETRDASGNDLNVSLMGMPAESDWILSAPYNDVSMIRNLVAYKLWENMQHYAPRTKMVELVLNNKYTGVYMLTEKIKRDTFRIDVAKMNLTDNAGREVTGGYIMKIDAENGNTTEKTFKSQVKGFTMAKNTTTQTLADITWGYEYPKSADITPQQQAYIKSYIDTFETYLSNGNMAYRNYISRTSFIDYFIHTEISKNADGFKKSAFYHKEKLQADGTKGKLKAGTVWDFNLGYGNCSFCNANTFTGWVYKGCETLPVPAMWQNLITKDSEYANALKCRYLELRQTTLNLASIHQTINLNMDTLVEASARQFLTYKELLNTSPLPTGGGFGGGNPNDPIGWFVGYRVGSYTAERDSLKNWYTKRLTWLDANMPGTCQTVGTNEETKQVSFDVYPNPSSAAVYVNIKQNTSKVQVYNLQGEMIEEFVPTKTGVTELESLENQLPGTYFVRLTIDGELHSLKVIKN